MKEVWAGVTGYEGLYQVSTFGRVRSLDRVVRTNRNEPGGNKRVRGRIMAQTIKKNRNTIYFTVKLAKEGHHRSRTVHRLVAKEFVAGDHSLNVLHGPQGPTINTPDNLRWGTQQDNCDDMARDGTRLFGELNPNSTLTEKKVVRIRQLFSSGKHTVTGLAKLFNLRKQLVSSVITRRTWAHL